MDVEKTKAVQRKILNILVEEFGESLPLDESVLVLAELISAITKASQPVEVVYEEVPEILPDQYVDVIQMSKEPAAIDRDEWSEAEKLENEVKVHVENLDKIDSSYKKKKKKAVAVEEFNDIRRLDSDDLF